MMAEWMDVMNQFNRMCQHYQRKHKCPMGCPMNGVNKSQCRKIAFECPKDTEKIVMAWAAEHSEPVYPTWFEVLERFGVAGRINGEPYYGSMDREIYLKQPAFTPKAFEPIPANIVEKLGIKPKEE